MLNGLDIRLCDSTELSTFFAEGQESLMAGSLQDLQSAHVMHEGSDIRNNGFDDVTYPRKTDAMNGLGDCWAEFRANIKQPLGFFAKSTLNRGKIRETMTISTRTVKAPDLPFE